MTLRRTIVGAAAAVIAATPLKTTAVDAQGPAPTVTPTSTDPVPPTPLPTITLEPSCGDDAPAWQNAILIRLSQRGDPYAQAFHRTVGAFGGALLQVSEGIFC